MSRELWFARFGVEPGQRDPVKPNSLSAVLTAEILLGCFQRAESERLQYKLDNWPGNQGQWNYEAKWQWQNYCLLVRAYFLLAMEPPAFELK